MSTSANYPTVMPYLILKGVDRFVAFVKEVFHAEELAVYRNEDGSILHAEIKMGTSVIMLGESGELWHDQPAGMYITVEQADHTFEKALQAGATVINPLEDKEYGRTCGVKDPFGNTWWITSPLPD